MSKAILVVDIPDFINSVTKGILKPIGAVGKLEIGYGSDDGEMIRFEFINTDGALLKPMPERINPLKVDSSNLLDLGYMHGRNDLINEMEGEEK